ncbi:hypothetical protein F4804DRAFT_313739 [Jackrogersella minutella]|nr:hypothetical protein F4804DRAFT_313739 [Jackrogersella minutella]
MTIPITLGYLWWRLLRAVGGGTVAIPSRISETARSWTDGTQLEQYFRATPDRRSSSASASARRPVDRITTHTGSMHSLGIYESVRLVGRCSMVVASQMLMEASQTDINRTSRITPKIYCPAESP